MGLPTLAKTWLFNINNTQTPQGSAILDAQLMIFNIKQALVAAGWTVVRSSNSVSVANSDLWAASTNLVWNGAAHSWIVLQNTALGTNFQICLDTNSTSGQLMTIAFCQGGYNTGTGTTSARPSSTVASDEVVLLTTASWGIQAVTGSYAWHLMYSSDLQCTRIIICNGGQPTGFWFFEKPQNPIAGWTTNPHICQAIGTSTAASNIITRGQFWTSQSGSQSRLISGLGTNTIPHYFACEGFGSSEAGNQLSVASDIDAAWAMMPIALWSATSPARGRNGQVFDLWYGIESLTTGTSYPSSGTLYQFVQFGVFVFPWQAGTAPLTA